MRRLAFLFAVGVVVACGSAPKAPAPATLAECAGLAAVLDSVDSVAGSTVLRFVITNASSAACLLPSAPGAVQVVDQSGGATRLQITAHANQAEQLRLEPLKGAVVALIYSNLLEYPGRVVFVELVFGYRNPVKASASGAICPPFHMAFQGPSAL